MSNFRLTQSFFEDVADFHVKFGFDIPEGPRQLPDDLAIFAIGFMCEELAEYAIASGYTNIARVLNDLHQNIIDQKRWMVNRNDMRDPEKQFDSLIDLVYVALGRAWFHGYDFNEGWDRVHAANMAKVRVDPETLQGSVRKSKFDVVKPRGWKPADLSDLVVSKAAVAAEKLMKP